MDKENIVKGKKHIESTKRKNSPKVKDYVDAGSSGLKLYV